MRSPWYGPQFAADLLFWRDESLPVAQKLVRLVEEATRDPAGGSGRPKRLCSLPSVWSRRITREHRLFYELVGEDEIHFIQARGHDLPQAFYDERRRASA